MANMTMYLGPNGMIHVPIPAEIKPNIPNGLFWVSPISAANDLTPPEILFSPPGWVYKQPAIVGGLGLAVGLVIGVLIGRRR